MHNKFMQALKLFIDINVFIDGMNIHLVFYDPTCFANILSGCAFVPSKHPHFDVGLHEISYALLYIVLQQVFNSSDPN